MEEGNRIEGRMDSGEQNTITNVALAVDCSSSNGGSNIDNSIMEWEMINTVDAAFSLEHSNNIANNNNVPVEQALSTQVEVVVTGNYDEDVDMESFSFDSESEDEKEGTDTNRRTQEFSSLFDIKLLQTVIEASAHALDTVCGKDVVMVAGKTGVGKSTLLQGIAGKKIHEIEHLTSFSGDVAKKVAYDAEDALPAFEIGHSKKSKTNAITALVREVGTNEVIYLDTPGFEDTSGVEMDIATAALLSQVAKRCKSLKFIILIHCASLIEDRGGAFRSVLQFTRAFVKDFEESKTSFMFLFSHTGEISGMMGSLDDVQRGLQEEILRTAEGTSDREVLTVLKYIRKSLTKKYPFVQIFHPLETNFPKLIDDIETKLTKVTDLTLAKSPSMTLASKLKLECASQSLVQSVRVALRENSQEIAKVIGIRDMLMFLNKYINVDCLRRAFDETESIVDERVNLLRALINNQVARGTRPDLEFNQEHINELHQILKQLRELAGSAGASGCCLESIRRCLLDFAENILARAKSAAAFHVELRKLALWAGGFDEFGKIYSRTCGRIVEYANDLSNDMLQKDVSSLITLSDKDIDFFVKNLAILNAISRQAAEFSLDHIVDKWITITSKDLMIDKVAFVFKTWSTAAEKISENCYSQNLLENEIEIKGLAQAYRVVQVMKKSLKSIHNHSPFHFYRLQELVDDTSKGIETAVIEKYVLHSTEMNQVKYEPEWKPRLFWMRTICHQFAQMEGNFWKRMEPMLFKIVEPIRSDLHKVSGEIENMFTMIQDHADMIVGENLANEFMRLYNFQWVDELLPVEEQFVVKRCCDVISIVNQKIELKRIELHSIFDSELPINETSVKIIHAIGRFRPGLYELEKFSHLINHHCTYSEICCVLNSTCNEILEGYVTKLRMLAEQYTTHWARENASGNMDYMHTLSGKLHMVLSNVDALFTTGSEIVIQQANEIQGQIYSEFAIFKRSFDTEFSSFDGSFNIKAGMLVTIQASKRFPLIRCQLIDEKLAKQVVVELLLKEARKIESSIEASSQWDEIDSCILKYENATVLDHFVGGEVDSRLRTIKRLRAQKEEQVDDQMVAMIQNHDFKGIGAFLSPLAQSNDQLKQHKFKSHRDNIVMILKDMISDVNRLLNFDGSIGGDASLVSKKINALNAAKSELHAILGSELNLNQAFRAIELRANEVLRQFSKNITTAINKKIFIQMLVNKQQGSIFLVNLRQYLNTKNVRTFESAVDKIKKEIDKAVVVKYVENFFSSDFKDGDILFKVIASLKQAEDNEEKFPDLFDLYETSKRSIEYHVYECIRQVNESISESKCFDDGITHLHVLHRHLLGGLGGHCSTELVSHLDGFIGDLRKQRNLNDSIFELDGKAFEENLDTLASQLHTLSNLHFLSWNKQSKRETYHRLCKGLLEKVESRFNQAQFSLNARDLLSVQGHIDFFERVRSKAGNHVDVVPSRIDVICKECVDAFCALCTEVTRALKSDNCMPFKESFADYRGFIIHTTCVLKSHKGKNNFSHVNQLLYESLENAFLSLNRCIDADIIDSSSLRCQIVYIRSWGSFAADHLTLFREEVNSIIQDQDEWLEKIVKFSWDHFNVGRDLSTLKYCAILGVVSSATSGEINKAYKEHAKKYHPDKNKSSDANAKFLMIKEAKEKMLSARHRSSSNKSQPFDELLISLGHTLRDRAKSFMKDQRYDLVEKLLFELSNIKILSDLVVPKLKDDVSPSVFAVVKSFIDQSRVEVDSLWAERNYRDLNEVISSLKKMEQHFKTYTQLFSKSWDTGISNKIESEIEILSDKARACLQSRAEAEKKKDDFRRCFIQMGFVLTELPAFRNFTKSAMSGVLESCLSCSWGYGYLFELGLALQKGDDASTDSENRVAQMIVNEFSHFKEVLVMVWNEEVLQKPADEVIMHIKGEVYSTPTQSCSLSVDHNQLLDSFAVYEAEYKSLIADYIKPDVDLNALVHKTLALARQVSPLKSGSSWGDDLKKAIPLLLAGVFSLLTVLKSGASYNRIEEAKGSLAVGEKLLMKPHNIQVLSLLLMLGCGVGKQKSIDNQLLQIRTGEGKSMILGAASVMFALIGFRVHTVCYSEFLSKRDFQLFEDVFARFGLIDCIKYSKITCFAEDTTAAKGDIRGLTESLLRGTLVAASSINSASRYVLSESTLGKSAKRAPASRNKTISGDNSRRNKRSKIKALADGSITTMKLNNCSHISATSLDTSDLGESDKDEILLVDEVDVFFGSEFYGQTYNQVLEFREPEIEDVLTRIWNTWSIDGRRLTLSEIKDMPEYRRLLRKLSSFSFVLDNEILLMLDQVSKVDSVPYHVDVDNDRIGYKVLDSISYDVTYGYCTSFAYLKELSKFRNKSILSKVLAMHVSCGQFSYANISPHRILGVSGTLQALSELEREILLKYGLNKYLYVPSVYGSSNFEFDKAGEGIYLERTTSDFYHRITARITSFTKAKQAVIVFFQDRSKLDDFIASPMYRKLNRHKKLLLEDMSTDEKSFVISKAATAGQITLSTAVFGRGTDFFGKDEVLESNGGVHIIQTFLSEELSEEIQIQGRTARQGKRGSYQMILLESDLQSQFGVRIGDKDKIPQKDLYDWLCSLRLVKHKKRCQEMEENLKDATLKDCATHKYFDYLIAGNARDAKSEYEDLYRVIKKAPMPTSLSVELAFAIDVTGSMAPYSSCVVSTVCSLVSGQNSILEKLKTTFPEIEFNLRVGSCGFRDIDDKGNQFQDMILKEGHFTDNITSALKYITSICANTDGGADIAEDHIGAICHCANDWNHVDDWTAEVKFIIIFSDAPAHGLVNPVFSGDNAYDSYPTVHPDGLKTENAISWLLAKDISLIFCSFDPHATARTEEELLRCMEEHPDNNSDGSIVLIPMVPKQQVSNIDFRVTSGRHVIFVLDESGSMQHLWGGVVAAYKKYVEKRKQSQSCNDIVSVVQFDSTSRVTVSGVPLNRVPESLPYNGGGTCFYPAAQNACNLARNTPESKTPVIIFMSDGGANDADKAAREFTVLNQCISSTTGEDLELHVIAFGGYANTTQLETIARSSKVGKVHASANIADLTSVFVAIAENTNVATVLESEIAKRMSEVVSNKLTLEYFGQ